MKILIALGHPNPVANAAWARIGFLADSWSKQGHSVEVLGAFSPKSLDKRGSKILVVSSNRLAFLCNRYSNDCLVWA